MTIDTVGDLDATGLRRPVVWLIRIGFLGSTLFLMSLLGEVAFRTLLPQDLSGFWFVVSARGYSHNKSGGTARHQFGGRVVHYRFNAYHLRGAPVDFGRRRILVLGDSFTFGWLLDEQNTYVAKLSRACARTLGVKNCQFLNGGAGGWGTADSLAFLEDFGPRLSPDVVIVFLNFDDARRSLVSGLYRLHDNDRLELDPLRKPVRHASLKRILNGMPGYQWLLEHSQLAQAARRMPLEMMILLERRSASRVLENRVESANAVALEKALFRGMRHWCQEQGARLLVIATGFQGLRVEQGSEGDRVNEMFFREAPSFFKDEGIAFGDISDRVLGEAGGDLRPFIIPGDVHPNEAGADLIAREAWRWLQPQLASLPPRAG